jgi:hypothetical protein
MEKVTNKGKIWTWGILALLGAFLIYIFIIGRNTAIGFENRISETDGNWKTHHASIFGQMKQMGLSVEKYGSLAIQAIEAKYGNQGSQAAVLFSGASEMPSPEIMSKLNVVIEAGYNKLASISVEKQAQCRVYKDWAQQFPGVIVTSILSYPTQPFEKLCEPVSSAQSKADFNSRELSDPEIFKN